jgi:hypothetical protein
MICSRLSALIILILGTTHFWDVVGTGVSFELMLAVFEAGKGTPIIEHDNKFTTKIITSL